MSKYEFDLSVGIKEVLDADAAKKVESQVEAQRKQFEEPIELTLSIGDAKKRFKELENEAKKVQKSLDKALSSQNFDGISRYTKQMSNIQKEQGELLAIIGEQTKAITQQSDAIKSVEATERRRKKTVDNITAATEDTVAAIKEQAKAINEVARAEAKLNKTKKSKQKASTQKEAPIVNTAEEAAKAQEQATQSTLRTQKQVNAELDNELKKLKEIEAQQAKNDAARERFKKKQSNYGQEVLGVKGPVYDMDLIKGASEELNEFNELLNTRNKYQEKYNKLCRMIENRYTSSHGISQGMYSDLDAFVEANKSMKELDTLFESGQKTTNKHINTLFTDVVQTLVSEMGSALRMLNSGAAAGDMVGQRLDKEETELNREMQDLLEAREAQLKKINALRQEELDLIKKAGQEEAKLQNKDKKTSTTSNAESNLDKTQLEKKQKDLEYSVRNQKHWLDYLDKALDQENFKTTGKRAAAERLKTLSNSLWRHRNEDYENYFGEDAKEMLNVSWMHGYQEAQRQNVAQSILSKYHDFPAEVDYERSLAVLQKERDYREKVLLEDSEALKVVKEQIMTLQQQEMASTQSTNTQIENSNRLKSSYEGLAETVEKYDAANKKMWSAYIHNGPDLKQLIDERNATIDAIKGYFPANFVEPTLSQDGIAMRLAAKEFQNFPAADTLGYLETALKKVEAEQAKQARIAQEAESATKAQAEAERQLAQAATESANAKKKQLSAGGQSGSDVSVEEIIKRDIEDALAQLRSAKNNETSLFTLKGVFEGDDLIDQAQEMVKNIAEQANLTLSSFNVTDNTVKVKLYNDELKITVDQMYKLRAATEEADAAQLELVSQSFSQNVKALNANTFDTEGIQQRALASIEKVRSSLHGLEYDLTDLESAAKNITSQDDFVKFNNQLKAAQDNIQAIKNSTVSKNSMNPLANMQRDMQNASIEIETMRLKLEKFGDIQGVAEAKQMITEMAEAAQQYNSASNAQDQQGAYNQYSNLRSSFKAQTEYINAVKSLNSSQASESKKTDPIRDQYKSLLDIINKINTVNTRLTDYQNKDAGSGILSGYIKPLQQEKQVLLSELENIKQEVNNSLGDGFVQGENKIKLPLANSIGSDLQVVEDFLNSTKTQTSLTTEEINRFVASLQKAQDIDVSFLGDQLKQNQEKIKQAQKEAAYFSNKTQFSDTLNIDNIQKLDNVGTTTKETLEGLAQTIAKNSDGAVALTKNFSQSADGIARLDFSVFDKSVGSLRDFRIELGTTTGQIGVYETTVNKSLANIQAAQKQLQSVGSLIGRLGVSGVNVGEGSAPTQVAKLLEMYKQLSAEISKGDGADQNKITKLTKDLKLASSETEKFYKQMIQMEDAIVSGKAKDLGVGDIKGDVYGQLVKATKELVGTNQNATLEFGRFDAATNTLNASLVHANGTVENFQVQMNGLNGQMVAQQSGVTKLTTSWDRFKSSMSKAGKQLVTAFAGYNVFYKAISEVRKGISYVKEIDLALTELKKVTDETEESYRKFLNTAAGTAGEIGSTVSDFTEASANFARLGYTMEESAEMAKTAIVYRNVADGLDTVEESTDSIISTMKAFGIESDNTMGIVDRFNEVGNNFAITSAGIGEALQRSASALYAGGNTIDESIALVTAANSVVILVPRRYSNMAT